MVYIPFEIYFYLINFYFFIFFTCLKKMKQKKGQPFTWPSAPLRCLQRAAVSESRFRSAEPFIRTLLCYSAA
jgi:hypothetical protein